MTPRSRGATERFWRVSPADDAPGSPATAQISYFWGRLRLTPWRARIIALPLIFASLGLWQLSKQTWWPETAWLNYPVEALTFAMPVLAWYLCHKTLTFILRKQDDMMVERSLLNGETPAEARARRRRFYREHWLTVAAMLAVVIGLFALFGTRVVFSWGGILPAVGATTLAAVVGLGALALVTWARWRLSARTQRRQPGAGGFTAASGGRRKRENNGIKRGNDD